MCEALPGVRCATDCRQVADETAQAYYAVLGDDAPPIGGVARARWQTEAHLAMDARSERDKAVLMQRYVAQVEKFKAQATSPEEALALTEAWRAELIDDAARRRVLRGLHHSSRRDGTDDARDVLARRGLAPVNGDD